RLTASVLASRAWLFTLRGDLIEAEKLVTEIRKRSDPAMQADRRGFGFVSAAEARLALELGQPERALAALGDDDTPINNWVWVTAHPEVRARAGDLDGARRAMMALTAVPSPLLAAEAAYAEGLIHLASSDPPGAT